MKTISPQQLLDRQCEHLRQELRRADVEGLARRAGFLRRCPRKIPMLDFLLALLAVAGESFLTLERLARVIALAAKQPYSKQALHKRLTSAVERFLGQVTTALFGQLPEAQARQRGWLAPFGRVLLHDSTVESLPEHLAKVFPGSRNQRQGFAGLKVQFVTDLLSAEVVQVSLSSFRSHDRKAASDILEVLRPGDLLIRDLGYFVIRAFQWIDEVGAFFLSRCRSDVTVYDHRTGQVLDLVAELRRCGRLDRQVLLGRERLAVRLVALPVPEEVQNTRRRRLKQDRDQRSAPSARRLFLLGWTLLITNVPKQLWPTKALLPIYRLRWRIEVIFKAWKSQLRFREFHCRSAEVLRLCVMVRLCFCALVYRYSQALELLTGTPRFRHVSLNRVARVLASYSCLIQAALLDLTPYELLNQALTQHGYYETRADRKNFFDLVAMATGK
jgi:hypothetical protein